ncbi:aminodeoxychorismate synthase, component I [Caulobacter segnis]|uniref:Para-aminobenzoate synthase component I n=2 Tax=Caulobacter segnis TaxID=88688 RepID=D5VN09_CAUST|nr:aminodeoxychorismate synthase, component I [Caulobacter segnis]ADG11882.1 para-aminobenzoate synthase component I [Caulobacter segnis ATCC 21756]AVQ03514.1 aminodeoxychorismate synthase, component I [Caulobacter segnis]
MRRVAILTAPWREPVWALAPFRDEPYACAMMSGGQGGRWSYLLRAPDQTLSLTAADKTDPFAALADLLGPRQLTDPEGPPFQGGVVGLAAYELGDRVEALGLQRSDWPDLVCARYPALLAFDHHARQVLAIGRGASEGEADARARAALAWLDAPAAPRAQPDGPLCPDLAADDPATYEAAVAEVVERILSGEIFQANIARAWTGRLSPDADPFDLFMRLRGQSPAPFSAYLRLPGRAVVSNSPERFLKVQSDGAIETKPIKGTRPRDRDPARDLALAAELLASEKDRAENLMIVDLMRNDLARVSPPGSVRAQDLFRIESFANVHHLVSTVTARLAQGRGVADLLRASFPPGSITGAPKVQAMKVIAGLETPRGPYCGSLFWVGHDGALDSSVLIRTVALVEDGDGWRVEARAGAGIVADSDPRAERLEAEAKIAAIRRALTESLG